MRQSPIHAAAPGLTWEQVNSLPRSVEHLPRGGRLWLAWQDYSQPLSGGEGVSRLPEYERRLTECRKLLERASPDSDMLEVAKASAAVPILEAAIAREKPLILAEQRRLGEAKENWQIAWREYDRLLAELAELAARGAAPSAQQRSALASLLGEDLLP